MSIWAVGFESEYRDDSLRCRPGNKVCGRVCIPQERDCTTNSRRLKTAAMVGAGIAGAGVAALAAPRLGRFLTKRAKASRTPVTANSAQVEQLSRNLEDIINEAEPMVRTSGPGAAAPQRPSRKPRRPRPMRRKS